MFPSVEMMETKNGEDIFVLNAILGQITGVKKYPLACIRSVNTGATQFLPYTSCYGANCLQEEYDQCLNAANVAPCVYHTVILQSGFALGVLRNEPEPEEELQA